ncbi:MAG TPA: ABC transporter ATP-binding protein [Acidimicrobiales bacterium]|nr:ABC transporter ATP-binding protein [Acidimicrobiales bacterium]
MILDAHVEVTLEAFMLCLDLGVADGEVVAVLGPNGSGKTTLLRALAGLQPLSAGQIVLDSSILDDPSAKLLVPPEQRPCAMVFQDYLLFPHLTAAANVAFGPRSRGIPRAEAERRALAWLDRMGLADKARSKPGQLSGGQAQRVAVARALATDPRLLLLDEPMAALDVSVRGSVRHQLRQHLGEFGGSCIMVTHDPLDAAAIADRLIIIEAGGLVQQGTLREVTTRPRTGYVAELMGLNLLRGRASGTTLSLADGATLQIADPNDGEVFAVIAPRDVALYLDPPEGSPRNTWSAHIAEVHLMGDRARVLLDGPISVAAEITAVALAELGLTDGAPVWVSVKATQIDVYGAASG